MGIGRKEPGAGTVEVVNIDLLDGNDIDLGAGAVDAGTQRITLASDDPAVVDLASIQTATEATQAAVEIMDDWDETNRCAVNLISGQAGVAAGSGAVDALTQRVILASDDPAVVSLAVLDDWDESDRCKVNLISGQAGIAAGAGAVGATVPRITLASDDPAVASLAILDDWDAVEDSAIGTDGAVLMFEAKSSQKTAVDAGDAVIPVSNLNGEIVLAGFTWSTESLRVEEIDPVTESHVEETLLAQDDVTANTTDYVYLDMDGYRYFTIHGDISVSSDTCTITVEATLVDDGTAPGSITQWVDVTDALFGVESWVDSSFMAICDTPCAFKYIRVKYVTSDTGGDDTNIYLYAKRMW